MTKITDIERSALKLISHKHRLKWGAALGKRACSYEVSEDCLGTAREYNKEGKLQWKGRMCKECLRVKQLAYKDTYRMRDGTTHIIGRPRKSAK
jgi:hypothetical protein